MHIFSSGLFDPGRRGRLRSDGRFNLDRVDRIRKFAHLTDQLHLLPFAANHSVGIYWPARFIAWSSRLPCLNATDKICCNIDHRLFDERHLRRCVRWSTTRLAHYGYNDSLIYNNASDQLIGYTLLLPTTLTFSPLHRHLSTLFAGCERDIRVLFDESDDEVVSAGWMIADWTLTARWFELQEALLAGTPISMAVSLACAFAIAIVSTRTLLISLLAMVSIVAVIVVTLGAVVAMDWRINIIESTIVVLTVGISFDLTLHYASAYLQQTGTRMQRVRGAIETAAIPVSLSALSTYAAGFAMLPSTTQAFYQVSIFMMLITVVSWVYATLFFMSLLIIFGSQNVVVVPKNTAIAVVCNGDARE